MIAPETARGTWAARALLVTLAYFALGRLGLEFARENPSSTITGVWLPAGIAVAAVLVWGRSMLAAVWLAALAVNLTAGAAPHHEPAPFVIATGNSLEALLGAAILGHVRLVYRLRDATPILASVALAPLPAALVGAGALAVLAGAPFWTAFALWAAGDAAGILVVEAALAAWLYVADEEPA